MGMRDEIERLRRMAEGRDRDARDQLVRLVQRAGLVKSEDIRTYQVTVVDGAEMWRYDLSEIDAIVVTPDDPRFYATVGRMQGNFFQIMVVTMWGPPQAEAPAMLVDLYVGRRVRSFRVGGGPPQ